MLNHFPIEALSMIVSLFYHITGLDCFDTCQSLTIVTGCLGQLVTLSHITSQYGMTGPPPPLAPRTPLTTVGQAGPGHGAAHWALLYQ